MPWGESLIWKDKVKNNYSAKSAAETDSKSVRNINAAFVFLATSPSVMNFYDDESIILG